MKKIILIDGNNLLFRSYYATFYSGNMMKNSKGLPTNAVFGFVSMMNKIIEEEKPSYLMVAFDMGKSFRHDSFTGYKEGRIEMPEELRIQFPWAKKVLEAMKVKYLEVENYEADDIIGTVAKMVDLDDSFIGTIVSSDKDLLQLLSSDIKVKLLKQKDHILYDTNTFIEDYGIKPINIIDLKALEGDPSDRIPGVKGIGVKTALMLLKKYEDLDNIYLHLDEITGKVKEKLINDKQMAYFSKQLATIYKEVPINVKLEDLKYDPKEKGDLIDLYKELEFYSLLKVMPQEEQEVLQPVKIITDLKELKITKPSALYLEVLGANYHTAKLLGVAIYNSDEACYIPLEVLAKNPNYTFSNICYTYDLKKALVSLKWHNINLEEVKFDLMIAAYLLNYNIKNDIGYLANQLGYNIAFYETTYGKKATKEVEENTTALECIAKAKFIYEVYERFLLELEQEEMLDVFTNIEMPLVLVLADMEYTGIDIDLVMLDNIGEELQSKLKDVTKEVHSLAGCEFNISSPKQLGEVLFQKLQLPYFKQGKTGYSTDKTILHKLRDLHPIIGKILEYRTLIKIYGTYVEGLKANILSDNKIHTIYTQTLTRTGRLSSIFPNLQNIPIKNEEGRIIRKAFKPSTGNIIMSSDYSQIELRILAHFSKAPNLIEAFKKDMDIHTKTAMDIFQVSQEEVTKDMRRQAKAVNFGIIYGISSFGLSENLDINVGDAKRFIDKYLATFPGIKKYMEEVVKEAYDKGYVRTITNRKRIIEELKNPNYMIKAQGERMALNTPIQGSSADLIKKAMIEIAAKFKELNLKSKMILQVHDELVFDLVKEEKDMVAKVVSEIMENTFKLEVPLKVDLNFGEDWYTVK